MIFENNLQIRTEGSTDTSRIQSGKPGLGATIDDPGAKVSGNLRPTAGPAHIEFENQQYLNGKGIVRYYIEQDSTGQTIRYGTYDSTQELSRFTTFGLTLCLLFFSFYLFDVSSKLYTKYFDKKRTETLFINFILFTCILLNLLFITFVLHSKGLPFSMFAHEFESYPSEFVLGLLFTNFVLLGIGGFRLSLIVFTSSSKEGVQRIKDRKISFIGFVFSFIAIVADAVTLWSLFWH